MRRFTDSARVALILSLGAARELGHLHIDTEHMLLGLIAEREGVGAQALAKLGVSLAEARRRVEAIAGYGEPTPVGRRLRFTLEAKRVIRRSVREAQILDDDHIGSGHLLLGLILRERGLGGRILVSLGVGADAAREGIAEVRARQPSAG